MRNRWVAGALLVGVAAGAVFFARMSAFSVSMQVPLYRQTGPSDATVVITEYSDFQCPACAKAQFSLKSLIKRHEKDVLLVFRHNPWKRNHKWAFLASKAAESAGVQGKFWPYADMLFDKQADWEKVEDAKPIFLQYAKDLGLDEKRFEADMNSNRWDGLIERDLQAGSALDVNSTPTFFINKRRVVGGGQLESFGDRYIELEKGP